MASVISSCSSNKTQTNMEVELNWNVPKLGRQLTSFKQSIDTSEILLFGQVVVVNKQAGASEHARTCAVAALAKGGTTRAC